MMVARRFARQSQRWGVGDLIPYGAGTAYDTATGQYVIVGRPGGYADPGALHAALYAGQVAALALQQPVSTSVVLTPAAAGMVYYPSERFYMLPNGVRISEYTYQQAVREGTVAQLLQQYGAAPSPAPSAAAGYAPRVTLSNLTRPGQSTFAVGDRWTVTINGAPPNATVTCTARQNDKALGTTDYGRTDAAGNWQLSGAMGAEHTGTWVEAWRVGDATLPTLYFVVTAAGVSAPEPTGETLKLINGDIPKPAGIMESLKALPTWAWLAGAGVAVFLLSKGGRA